MFKHLRTLIITGIAALPLAVAAIPAHAGTATGTFNVTTTVVAACNVNSASNLVFPNYDPTSATATSGTSTIKVQCTKNSSYVIALNYGANGGTVTNRIMKDTGTDTLNYNLYTDNAHANVWKDSSTCNNPATPGTNCDGGSGSGNTAESYTVYGQIPSGQNVPAGSYSDTITVTVTF